MPFKSFGGLRVRTLSAGGELAGVSALHITMPARYRHASLYHERTHEWFYVLEGTTTILIEGKRRRLPPGSFLYIAPKVPHVVSSAGRAVKVLVFFSPPMDASRPDICLVQP